MQKRKQIATQFFPMDLSQDQVPYEGSKSLPKSDNAKSGFLAGKRETGTFEINNAQ